MRILAAIAILGLVVAPASANLLGSDGGFEPDASAWTGLIGLDSTIWGPGAGGQKEGDHYGSCQSGANGTFTATLTSIQVDPGEDLYFSGWITGGGTGVDNHEHWVGVYDATTNAEVAKWTTGVIPVSTYGFGWTEFNVAGVAPASGHVKVVFGFMAQTWGAGAGTHVDGLVLTPEPASLALFALAGLPLLRRRR